MLYSYFKNWNGLPSLTTIRIIFETTLEGAKRENIMNMKGALIEKLTDFLEKKQPKDSVC